MLIYFVLAFRRVVALHNKIGIRIRYLKAIVWGGIIQIKSPEFEWWL
jgi:hypothetical protein